MAEETEESTTLFEVTNPDLPEHMTARESDEEDADDVKAKKGDVEEKVTKEVAKDDKVEAVVEDYTPDFTYSVMDQKKEFPEWVRAAIKDKKAESELRDILTRAEGLAPVKEKFEGLSGKYSKLEQEHNSITSKLGELQHFIDNGNLDFFFKQVGIPQNKVVEYVAGMLRESDMTPEERARNQAVRQKDVDLFYQNKRLSDVQQQNRQLMLNNHQFQMEQALRMPEVDKVAKYVDSLNGAGSFKKAVDSHGEAHFHRNGYDLPPAEAVAAVMNHYKAFIGDGIDQSQNDLIQAKSELKSGRPTGHIPNVGKKTGASPVRKAIRSLDDLKKLAKQAAS